MYRTTTLCPIDKLMLITKNTVIKQFDEQQEISEFNVKSAYRSLRRIQKVYLIPASDMAAGRYKDRIIGDPMDGKFYATDLLLRICNR